MNRIESSVTSLSWIPREAVEGINRLAFRLGISHYDPPPPEGLEVGSSCSTTTRFALPMSSRRG